MSTFRILVIVGALALLGCGKKKEQPQSAMPGMQGMQGMVMRTDSLMPMMRADLDSLAGMPSQLPSLSGRVLETRLRAHVERVRRLLDMHTTMMQRMTLR